MEKDRLSFRHSQDGGGGEKIERHANSFLQFPQAEGINYRQTLCLFTWPRGNNRKLWSGTLEGWG